MCHDQPRSAYIHVPFCKRRCGYCNFTLVAGRDDLIDAYLDAIERELASLGGPHAVDTLFFGGGTPTHLTTKQLDRLFRSVRLAFPTAANCEVTVEGNPADLNQATVDCLVSNGVTRISLGAQSFDSAKLAFLDRDHDAACIESAVARIRPHIQSLSIDLIFGVPGESLDQWCSDIASALRLPVDHVSSYGLTFERGTSLWSRLKRHQFAQLDDAAERLLFESAIDLLASAGFEHYEVSNFARLGHRCRHNEVYWAGASYFAVGPGAARYVGGCREVNHRSTTTYIRRMLTGQSPVGESERLSPEDRAREMLVIGLRRIAGVDGREFEKRTGFAIHSLIGADLDRFIDRGWLRWDQDQLQLSRDGLMLSDTIWPYFLR